MDIKNFFVLSWDMLLGERLKVWITKKVLIKLLLGLGGLFMRRIGTISAAIGFIFLGIWMIISKGNPTLGDEIFKWWPMLIIILGIEVLFSFSRENEDNRRPRLNFLIIPVIIIFLSVNAFQGIGYIFGFDGSGFSFDNIIRWGENFDLNNYKKIETSKILEGYGNSFHFETDSGLIRLFKTTDKNIKIDAKVYVSKGSSRNSYDIDGIKSANGYTVSMKEDYIKKVYADIYIPDGYNIGLVTDSSSIKTDENLINTKYDIRSDSSNIELNGGESLVLNIDSGKISTKDIKDVKIKGDSGSISLSGNTETVDAKLDSGTFSLRNTVSKNVNVELNSGVISIKTKDKNVEVNAELDSGICSVAGEKRINSGLSKILGNGEDKVRIKLDSGTITFSSQE